MATTPHNTLSKTFEETEGWVEAHTPISITGPSKQLGQVGSNLLGLKGTALVAPRPFVLHFAKE